MQLLRHPLRDTLTKEDLERIHTALETEDVHNVSNEELDAVNDILYDAIAGERQTHLGVTTLQ